MCKCNEWCHSINHFCDLFVLGLVVVRGSDSLVVGGSFRPDGTSTILGGFLLDDGLVVRLGGFFLRDNGGLVGIVDLGRFVVLGGGFIFLASALIFK